MWHFGDATEICSRSENRKCLSPRACTVSERAALVSVASFGIFLSNPSLVPGVTNSGVTYWQTRSGVPIPPVTSCWWSSRCKLGFLSHCYQTLLVQRSANVRAHWLKHSLAGHTADIRSIMIVLIALIVMLRDRLPFLSDTSSSLTSMNSSRTAIARSSSRSASVMCCRRICSFRCSVSRQRRAPQRRWRSDQECSWPPRTSLHKPSGQCCHHALRSESR